MTKTLHFNVTGAFVTNTARTWFWCEKRPLESVLDFLKSCMKGTNQTEKEIEEYAIGVIIGKYKFTGDTNDNTYSLVPETKTDVIQKDFRIPEWTYVKVSAELLNYPNADEYIEQRNAMKVLNQEYGWLAPDGTFHIVDFGGHDTFAQIYMYNHEDLFENYNMSRDIDDRMGVYGSALGHLGWVMIRNAHFRLASVVRIESKKLTKAQKEFLFDFYHTAGQYKKAKQYLD